jgi:hypothetical protein
MPGLFLRGPADWSSFSGVELTLTIFETITFPKQSARTRILQDKSVFKSAQFCSRRISKGCFLPIHPNVASIDTQSVEPTQ